MLPVVDAGKFRQITKLVSRKPLVDNVLHDIVQRRNELAEILLVEENFMLLVPGLRNAFALRNSYEEILARSGRLDIEVIGSFPCGDTPRIDFIAVRIRIYRAILSNQLVVRHVLCVRLFTEYRWVSKEFALQQTAQRPAYGIRLTGKPTAKYNDPVNPETIFCVPVRGKAGLHRPIPFICKIEHDTAR